MKERANRSDHYQFLLHEISVSDEYLCSFTNDQSIGHALNPFKYDEEYHNLKDQLKKEFWKVAESVCTERQWIILKMLCDGYTQMEMAKILDVNQSSITKSIHGNLDYNKGRKVYGGVTKKLKKACANNTKINDILERMSQLREEQW